MKLKDIEDAIEDAGAAPDEPDAAEIMEQLLEALKAHLEPHPSSWVRMDMSAPEGSTLVRSRTGGQIQIQGDTSLSYTLLLVRKKRIEVRLLVSAAGAVWRVEFFDASRDLPLKPTQADFEPVCESITGAIKAKALKDGEDVKAVAKVRAQLLERIAATKKEGKA